METEVEDYKKKKEKLKSISIQVSTLPELRLILEELGKSEEEVQMNLAHENAHANVASALGANHDAYTVYFLKNGNTYQTNVSFPSHMTQDEVERISRDALSAPEIYGEGGGLSGDDEKLLEDLT